MGAGRILAAIARGYFPPLLLVSLAGWIALLASEHWLILPGFCSANVDSWLTRGLQGIAVALAVNPPTGLILTWLVMLLAMMPPLLMQPMMHLWDRSFARRRLRAIAFFVAGYGAVWLAVGIALMAMAIAVRVTTDATSLPAIVPAIAIALLWQITPAKQACLNRCHGLPRLSAFGVAADRDCLRYGLIAAVWCVGACWALMLIPLVAEGTHVLLMAVISVLLLAERLAPARPALWRLPLRSRGSEVFTVLRKNQGSRT